MTDEIRDLYARMQLDADDESPFKLTNSLATTNEHGTQLSLIGRFVTDRPINLNAMQDTLSKLWRPVKGVWIKDLGPNLFMYQFGHEMDMEKVLFGGPWISIKWVSCLQKLWNTLAISWARSSKQTRIISMEEGESSCALECPSTSESP
ncbi:hypothetical protein LguiA_005982 [Lonicera macranthoides]